MSEVKKEVKMLTPNNPYCVRKTYEGKKDFDKYWIEKEEKQVFVKIGKDEAGDELGTVETRIIEHKVDIREFLESQRDTVGVDAYIRNLALQGVDINEFSTNVDDNIVDVSQLPDTLADTLMLGDKAKEAFANLDPVLKGDHTTIEGFLNSLSPEVLEKFYKEKLGVVTPAAKEGE